MISSNPFADLSTVIPNYIMQGYVVAMFIMVIGGTILDMIHKRSAQYFFANSKKAKAAAVREVGAGAKASIAAKTVANEIIAGSHVKSY